MKRHLYITALFAFLLAMASIQASAGTFVLTFEGLQDQEAIGNYYNGGYGGAGSGPGPNDGVVFGSDSQALVSGGPGGADFTGQPSGDTVAFFMDGPGVVLNVAGGFHTAVSLFYSSPYDLGEVTVWSDPNGSGTKLADLILATTPYLDDAHPYINWAAAGVSFTGTARSAIFTGSANYIGFDDITLQVPEPASILLIGAGLLVGTRPWRKRQEIG